VTRLGAWGAALFCALVSVPPPVVAAQEHPLTLELHVAKTDATGRVTVRPGAALMARVHATIPGGWHLYSTTQPAGGPVPTSFAVLPTDVFRIRGVVGSPVPNLTPDPNFGIITEWYEDSATFRVPVAVSAATSAGSHALQLVVAYQTCNARYCLPPTQDTLRLDIVVAGVAVVSDAPGAATTAPGVASTVAPTSSTPQAPTVVRDAPQTETARDAARAAPDQQPASSQHSTGSFALFLWLAATMGALSLLTPCVFPMVPITVSYFSRQADASRRGAIGNALLYAGGIVGAFSGLGLGAALLIGVAGLNRFAADPWLNVAIALVFSAFALSLFDVLHIALPSGMVNWLDRRARGNAVGRAGTTLAMGATFAVTTLTCTAPFVGTLLVSASQGDWRWPAAGLVVFSSVLALPFFVLALVPRVLTKLPRSGTWMQTLKGTLGFIELAAATKFLSNADLVQGWGVFTRTVVLVIWIVLGVLLAAYLLGVRAGHRLGTSRYVVPSLAALAVTVWLGTGLRGARLGELESFLPPAGRGSSGVSGTGELSWVLNDYAGALAQAKREQRLVLIDFTGYTCTNCRWMEANMFTKPEIKQALDRFVRARLFTDGKGALYVQQQTFELTQFKTVALPLYAIVDGSGATRATFLGMTRDAREFSQFLSGALATPQ
jgi:thiol:disulfide interchange protein DsbD